MVETELSIPKISNGDKVVSYPTIFLLIKEISYLNILSRELKRFGFSIIGKTKPTKIDEIIKLRSHIDCFVIDMDIEDYEALDIYTNITQEPQYKNSPFIFLTDDKYYNKSSENTLFDEAIIISKKNQMEYIMEEILNEIRFPKVSGLSEAYHTGATGNLNEIGLSKLLNFCSSVNFNGALILSYESSTGIILLKKGEIEQVHYKNLSRDEALRSLGSLDNAEFRLEHKIFRMEEVQKNLEDSNDRLFTVKDILIDLFYFTHKFFEERISNEITEFIFKNKIYEYSLLFPSVKKVNYIEKSQEKIEIRGNINNEELEVIISLFKEIYFELSSQNKDISSEEFLYYIEEIKPYLENHGIIQKINFHNSTHKTTTQIF
jgi:hypothetical protein